MSNLTPRPGTDVAATLRANLRRKFGKTSDEACLLLDNSGSMVGEPIVRLNKLCLKFPGVRRFVFNTTCEEIKRDQPVPPSCGGTAMHAGFMEIRRNGISHCVIITDGEPDSEALALSESQGLIVDVIYTGDPPMPTFLEKLANMRGGKYDNVTFDDLKVLESKVMLLLEAGKPAQKGPILL